MSISNGAPTHCFMEVIKDTTAKSPKDVFVRCLDSDTKLISNGDPSYGVCAARPWTSALVHFIQRQTSTRNIQMAQDPKLETARNLSTEHTTDVRNISNLCLEEFAYRFNRRHFEMSLVERLLNTCVFASPHPLLRESDSKMALAYET